MNSQLRLFAGMMINPQLEEMNIFISQLLQLRNAVSWVRTTCQLLVWISDILFGPQFFAALYQRIFKSRDKASSNGTNEEAPVQLVDQESTDSGNSSPPVGTLGELLGQARTDHQLSFADDQVALLTPMVSLIGIHG